MTFKQNEWKLITLLALIAPTGAPVKLRKLSVYFDRKCNVEKSIRTLELWQLATYDPYTGEARLLVQPLLRVLSCGPTATQPVLFEQERPLDAVLAQVCATPANIPRVAHDAVSVPQHSPCVPEHAKVQDHTNVTSTFNRKDVSTIKRLTLEELQRQVCQFVGEDDFVLHWEKQAFWSDDGRMVILEGTLRFLRAGIKSKDIRTKTTPGKHLWNQFQHDCRAKGIEAIV